MKIPLYDYACNDCEHEFEFTHPAALIGKIGVPCPKCKGRTHKIIGGTPHVILGWKAYSSRDDGHLRNVIHASRRGISSPLDQNAGR